METTQEMMETTTHETDNREMTAQETAGQPAEAVTEEATEQAGEAPAPEVSEISEAPAQEVGGASAQEVSEAPAQEAGGASAQEVSEAPAPEAAEGAEAPAEQEAAESSNDSPEESVDEKKAAEKAAIREDIAREKLAREKRAILREAREALRADEYDPDAIAAILDRFDKAGDAGEMAEAELARQREEIVQRNEAKKNRIAERAGNAEKKRGLIAIAKELADSEDWKGTSAKFKTLMEDWRKAGNAGEEGDSLWEEFNAARQAFFARQRAHYDELDSRNAERRQEKEKLIAAAKEAAEDSTDWKKTHEKLEEIFASWKQVGSAGRDDERLWRDFQNVRNAFYERRTAARNEQEQIFKVRREDKEALVAQAERFVSTRDYSPKAMERMREMGGDWKDIGFCGRKQENELWERFHTAQDTYWKGRRAASEQRHEEWAEKTRGAIERRTDRVARLKDNIDNLKERAETAGEEKKAQIAGWIEENEEQIKTLEAEIARMTAELEK
ncbi:MAG: DUF349 domain-containing protein [Lachnospiraceae bacterium]|nr:DUF349 domain-containing protein [Lachnospiraceae bacterium]